MTAAPTDVRECRAICSLARVRDALSAKKAQVVPHIEIFRTTSVYWTEATIAVQSHAPRYPFPEERPGR